MYLVLEIIPSFWVFKGSSHNYTCILILNFEITYRILLIFIHRHFVLILNFINVFITIISMCEVHCIHIGMCVCMCMYVVCVSVGICEDKRTKKSTRNFILSYQLEYERLNMSSGLLSMHCYLLSHFYGPWPSLFCFDIYKYVLHHNERTLFC